VIVLEKLVKFSEGKVEITVGIETMSIRQTNNLIFVPHQVIIILIFPF